MTDYTDLVETILDAMEPNINNIDHDLDPQRADVFIERLNDAGYGIYQLEGNVVVTAQAHNRWIAAARFAEQLQRQAIGDAATIDRLAGWKESAMSVLAEWDRAWEAAGRPGHLGQSRAEATRQWIEAHR